MPTPINEKKCIKCNIIKNISEFHKDSQKSDGLRAYCKCCIKLQSNTYYNNNYETILTKNKKYKNNNKELISKRNKIYYEQNKNEIQKYHKQYYINNKELIINKCKTYQKLNINKIKTRRNQYILYKKSSDINFKLKELLKTRIRNSMKNEYNSKSTMELLGCSIIYLKIHLQQTAINNGYLDFNIENYSGKEYHIDHIKPCASFDLSKEEEQLKCFHYSNLQILSAKDNLKKRDYYDTNKKTSME